LFAAIQQADGSGDTALLTRDVVDNDMGAWTAVDAGGLILDGAGFSIGAAGSELADSLLGKGTPGDPIVNSEVSTRCTRLRWEGMGMSL
jgi:hypothetical protein